MSARHPEERRSAGEGRHPEERQSRRATRDPQIRLWLVASASLLLAACRAPAPPGRDALQDALRVEGLTARQARGHRVFLQRCATCHGPEGRGDGQNAYSLDPPPPDFQESLPRLSAADRRKVVEGGTASLGRSPLCPPFGRSLDPEDVDAVVEWLDVASRPTPDGGADRRE